MNKLKNNIWFKCISILLCIALISGGLLAILNDLLYVSPEERTSRAISKIYNEQKEYKVITEEEIEYNSVGKINKIYEIEGDLLFQSTGYNGYKNGTITVWVKIVLEKDSYNIDKVLLESYEKQTLMSKLGDSFYNKFEITDVTEKYKNGESFTPNGSGEMSNPVSGATYSATAGTNAVNTVIKWLGENK
ncbi:MAG: hypothetical protein MJ066_03940 [Clostridia bacterium]|nr:hypothetical protein [Clostridia bacterium]